MKKIYEAPVVEIANIENNDVVTLSAQFSSNLIKNDTGSNVIEF